MVFSTSSSLMGADYWPYRARRGDQVELGKPFHLAMKPNSSNADQLVAGRFPVFRIPANCHSVLPGSQSARLTMESWFDEFRYMQQTVDWGVLTYTMHPYVIGRGHRMLAFEDLVKRLAAAGAIFMTMEDAAAEARTRYLGGEQ